MAKMKTYILHATVNYVCREKKTGETHSATRRPTISIEASSEQAAINKAKKQQKEAIGTDWWPVISLILFVGHVTVLD